MLIQKPQLGNITPQSLDLQPIYILLISTDFVAIILSIISISQFSSDSLARINHKKLPEKESKLTKLKKHDQE